MAGNEIPPHLLTLRSKEGCKLMQWVNNECKDIAKSNGVDEMKCDKVGNRFATYCREDASVAVFDYSGKEVFRVKEEKVINIELSPKGNAVAVWKGPAMEGRKENLFIYRVDTGVMEHKQWAPFWPCMAWSWDEVNTVFYGMMHNGISIHGKDASQPPIGVFEGKWTNVSLSDTTPPTVIAACIPHEKDRDTTPTSIKVFRVGKIDKILMEYDIKVDSININWNKKGTAALIQPGLDSDKHGKSYYGEAALLLFQLKLKKVIPIPTGKSPIHDTKWNANGTEFLVIHGKMPNNETTLYDEQGNALHRFGVAPRNTIHWSPHGRFFALAGFGGLPGDVLVYDRKKLSQENPNAGVIGKFNMSMVTSFSFSPCSRYIMCCTTHPRMTTSNRMVIYKHTGEKLYEQLHNTLYDVQWQALFPKFFPDRDPSPAKLTAGLSAGPPKKVFRAPGSKGGSGIADSIKAQLSANKQTGYSNAHTSSHNKVGESFTSWRGTEEKTEATPSVPKGDGVVRNYMGNIVPGALAKPAAAPAKVKKTVDVPQAEVEDFKAKEYPDIEKALKAAKKKVQQCGVLKNKEGPLAADQVKKLAMFTSFKAEVAYLEALHKQGVKSQ